MTPFAVSKYELLALTSVLFAQQVPNMEIGRKRLRAWDQLGVADLADKLAMTATTGRELRVDDWFDQTVLTVDLSDEIVEWLIAALQAPKPGVWADTITRVYARLVDAQRGAK